MPTESLYRLTVEGERSALLAFKDDGALWAHQPWAGMYELIVDDGEDRVTYRYNDDYKRPAPSVAAMAAHPSLRLTLECCDEFATVAERTVFEDGGKLTHVRIDPLDLEWVEWEYDDEEDEE